MILEVSTREPHRPDAYSIVFSPVDSSFWEPPPEKTNSWAWHSLFWFVFSSRRWV